MIRQVKQFQNDALINSEEYRNFVQKTQSEILRGISTVAVLKIISNHAKVGIYGYELLKELKESTKNTLVIEEGTLYPLLKKLEKGEIIRSEHKEVKSRTRKYYIITSEGQKVQNHLTGFFSKLIESMSDLMEFNVALPKKDVLFCPNCANKIDLTDPDSLYCEVCGLSIQNLKKVPKIKDENGDELL